MASYSFFCCKKCREDVLLIASCHGGRSEKRSLTKNNFLSSTENTHMCKSEFLRAPGSFFALCSHMPAKLQKRFSNEPIWTCALGSTQLYMKWKEKTGVFLHDYPCENISGAKLPFCFPILTPSRPFSSCVAKSPRKYSPAKKMGKRETAIIWVRGTNTPE